MPFSAILHKSYRRWRLSYKIWGRFLAFQLGRSDSQPPPTLLSARLTGDALTFYRSLTTAQKGDCDELMHLFRQQNKPNADVLKAQVKSRRQLPGKILSAFYRMLLDLAVKPHTDDAARKELVLATFIEALANSAVQWEVRKNKPTGVEDAIGLALKMQSYLNLHRQQPDTSTASVYHFTGPPPSQSEHIFDLIFTIKDDVKQVVGERSSLPQQGRTGGRLPAADRNTRSRTATLINVSATIETKTKQTAPKPR